jgi:cardiolipin synthase
MTANKIVNLPNLLTLIRFLLIIPFVYYFFNSKIRISLLIFAIITLSDKLDGISARLMNQKTELGSGFDSFTDWTLIITTLILLVMNNYISILWVLLLVIPSLISGVLKMLYAKKQKTVPVTFIARLSVGLTYITIISILINFGYTTYLLTITAILVYLAMMGYIFKAVSMPKKSANKNKMLTKASV